LVGKKKKQAIAAYNYLLEHPEMKIKDWASVFVKQEKSLPG